MESAVSVGEHVQRVLEPLSGKLKALKVSPELDEALDTCRGDVEDLAERMPKTIKGRVFDAPLNAAVGGTLPAVARSCGDELNAKLPGAPLSPELADLTKDRMQIADIVENKVNHQLVKKRAKEDSALAIRALDALSKEINLLSLDPVFLYDIASVRSAPIGDLTRHALGGGVRLTFASHISFTGGYAANLNRSSGEPSGAAFFNIKFVDLIR